MTPLLKCACATTELFGATITSNSVNITEAFHRSLSHRSPLSYKYVWDCVPLVNGCKFGHMETHFPFIGSPICCMKKENSTGIGAHKGLCEVVWIVEADLLEGERLYVTGQPTVLGCWESEMAVPMSPTEQSELWRAEIQVASGASFKYNYFIKGETGSSGDIIWRPGPQFSLVVPLYIEQHKTIMVRDSWIRYDTTRMPTHTWGSLIEEPYLPLESAFIVPATDACDIVKSFQGNFLESKPLINCLDIEENLDLNSVENDDDTDSISEINSYFSDRDQPVEEPWLPHSSLFSVLKDKIDHSSLICVLKDEMDANSSKRKEAIQDKVLLPDFHDSLLPVDKSDLSYSQVSVSTNILITSSICTMQRVAVLEDGKLVELLLEPVKNNVQSDSVYLGVVTKLVPHMGGAFVNIGSSRHSLMGIKQNREPFIFPPFRHRRKKKAKNGSMVGAPNGQPDANELEHTTHDSLEAGEEVDSQDNLTHDDYGEHDIDSDFHIQEVLEENLNGSAVDYGDEDVDFEDSVDSNDHEKFDSQDEGPRDDCSKESMWPLVRKGTKIIVQVVKEGLGTKGPTLTPYPKLRSRFWILLTRCERVGVSRKISGVERTRLKVIAKTLQPPGFGVTLRTVAAGHSLEELRKDLERLFATWKNILEHAKSAALAANEGVEGAAPVILHRAMGQTLSVVQDYFNEKVERMVVDSPRTYHEVTNYLQEIAPDLCSRVELYDQRIPLFDKYKIEEEINSILSKRVPLPNGGSLVIEQTEALVSIDVNGGHGMLGHGATQEKAILDVNLAAAKQIARELRLRDIGGIIVVDFIDMADESNKRLVYEEVKKAVERDRSTVKVSELSRHGLMEITRKRVRPSVTFMISEPCSCCNATGRVEALETSFSKIEQEICRLLVTTNQRADSGNPKTWPRFILRVDHQMCNYLTSGKRTKLGILSSSLKVWVILKVAREFSRGKFELKPFTDDKGTKNRHHGSVSVLKNHKAKTKGSGKKVTALPIKKIKASRK